MDEISSIPIHWPETVPGAVYRVVLKEDSQETGKTVYVGPKPSFNLMEKLEEDKHYTLRIEHNQGPEGAFTGAMLCVCLSTWLPYQEPTISLETAALEGALYYRFVVKNLQNHQVVIDRRTLFPRLKVPLSRFPMSAPHSWFAQSFIKGQWISCGPSQRLPFIYGTATATQEKTPRRTPELLFILSIDTEGQIKLQSTPNPQQVIPEQIFCTTPGGEVGIRYQMDMLEKRGAKGTFFIDILMAYVFGEKPTRQVIDGILERGHDVQLHLHPSPNLRGCTDPALRDIDRRWTEKACVGSFRDALDVAYGLFDAYTGQKPVAFRNGAYHLQEDYFPVLAEYGLLIDSSLYPYKNCRLKGSLKTASQPFLHPSGVLELPVGWLGIATQEDRYASTQFTAKTGTYGRYLLQMIAEAHEIFANHALVPLTFILHSYTFLKAKQTADPKHLKAWNRAMKQKMPPFFHNSLQRSVGSPLTFFDEIHHERIQFVHDLLDAVAANPHIKIVTFKEIHEKYFERLKAQAPSAHTVPVFYRELGVFRNTAFQAYSPDHLKEMCGV
jgi:hypothetical protein